MKPRLQEHYDKALKASLMEEFGYKNVMEVPRLDKIVVNMGVGEAVADTKKLKSAVGEMALITGQQPVVTNAKTSVATFKLREGMPIVCNVTLRRDRMYEFLDRLATIALPPVRAFRGHSVMSFNGPGHRESVPEENTGAV